MSRSLDAHFRAEQAAYAASHRREEGPPQHTAHILPVATAVQLAISFDNASNYRMQTPFTNQSTHTRMDNAFLNGTANGAGFTYPHPTTQQPVYVSPQQQVDRLQQQIDYMRETGDLRNPTNYNYARANAQAMNMDQRTFNNVPVRREDLTQYRGVGRPRASDYTSGGNLRRAS